ncbi:hypothetical protein DLE60_29855 [Micromonospora globispora]|uniref:Uncharacterized protein n=1 Tax=Micromonospora globispora TaxID=1450148 RepID=A0A317K6C9_9ACTN|nr:hypothetical protein [Micromonospora globispora]PWU48646.1 hypothetical protein DLJ46_11485 [Micromonospora globispora]PWU54380.1 hypothetical protein DLE60_29855 [Micromonospora globispora]RQW83984.1 hypothetical protein DKL51_31025 [Micromonospora globispora]
MTDRTEPHEHIEALGQPPNAPADLNASPEFAGEHEETAVDEDIITGEDEETREPEAPRGWDGENSGTSAT